MNTQHRTDILERLALCVVYVTMGFITLMLLFPEVMDSDLARWPLGAAVWCLGIVLAFRPFAQKGSSP